MALDATKWVVQVNKAIRYTGPDHEAASANYVTVLELHRWLQDLADGASVVNDDFLDITTVNPSDKKYDTIITLTNGYTLDDTYATKASQFIYGGSIIQGTVGVDQIIYDGVNVVANRGVIVNVIQNGAVLATKFWNSTPNGESFAGLNAEPTTGTAMRFMVKVHDYVGSGGDIDNRALIFTTREWGKTFSEFRIPATGRGVNVVPLTYATDLNNATTIGTIAALSDISNTEGLRLIDVDNNSVNEEYYSEWNKGAEGVNTINTFYEYMKWLTRNGATTVDLYGLDGELFRGITHSIETTAAASPGVFVAGSQITWPTGTGQVLAYDATDKLTYIQLKTGVVPGNGAQLTQGANTATTITDPVVEKTVSTPFCGASTGSSIVGAYGFALEYADLAVNDKLQALDGVTRQPPNNVTFTVGGVAVGYRVLVGPEDGAGGLKYDQLTSTIQLVGAAVSSVIFTEAAPANTPPTSGKIRIHRADGSYTLHPYDTYTSGTKTFALTTPVNFSSNNGHTDKKFFISYIDAAVVIDGPNPTGTTIKYTTIQTSTQTLFVEARFGGTGPNYTDSIKPARTTGTLGSTGGSATVSTVSDA